METLDTLLARKFNVYLHTGNPEVPAIQIGSYLTAGDAYNAVQDWQGSIRSPARVCVYVNESGNTRGGELVAVYGPHGAHPALSGAARLGWEVGA